ALPFHGELEEWLPLWQHLDDCADVAGMLWDDWVAPSIKTQIACGLPSEQHARTLLVWLAGAHDLGKATPGFAIQSLDLAAELSGRGLHVSGMIRNDRYLLRHEVSSAAILARWLTRHTNMRSRQQQQVTSVVAGHHGYFPEARAVKLAPLDQAALFGTGSWIDVQDLLADRVAQRAGVHPAWIEWAKLELSQPTQMLLTGLVIMADWIAS